MPEVSKIAHLHTQVVDDAAEWYNPNRIPEAFRDVHPAVAKRAFRLAGNDWRRVVRDGNEQALTILNAVAW